jgi:hypothetical protein
MLSSFRHHGITSPYRMPKNKKKGKRQAAVAAQSADDFDGMLAEVMAGDTTIFDHRHHVATTASYSSIYQ